MISELDFHREKRTGIPELILAERKGFKEIVSCVDEYTKKNGRAIVTRANRKIRKHIKKIFEKKHNVEIYDDARICIVKKKGYKIKRNHGIVAVLSAGASDFGVAEEARIIAEELGCNVIKKYDVGVAGIHRVINALKNMDRADAYVVVAGREGALPTVVSGLVSAPVIGVPASTGYGYGGKGKSALYAMLQSCAPIAVVNIDAGVIAGALAASIARNVGRYRGKFE
ncbi:MAG: nickel pincer cofactor biosynthesis protein LarB [Candidatus Thermoplasmatota archaeon]